MGLPKQRTTTWIQSITLLYLADWSVAQIVYSVSEEANMGTFVGNVAKNLNLNVKDLESRKIQMVTSSEKRYFHINVSSGVLVVNERIDREEICSNLPKCSLNVEVILSHPVTVHRIEINVIDINDNEPKFLGKMHVLNITELAFTGERFPLPNANDADVGNNAVKTYKLSANEHFSLDVQSGGDLSVSAELVLQKALDREKQSVIQLILTAVDGGKPARTGTLQIIINVVDVNDNSPVFSKSLYKVSVAENISNGTKLFTLNATDVDEGLNSEIAYSFAEHWGSSPLNIFAINAQTGEITVKGQLDYEENAAYELRVQAKDRGQSPRSAHCKILVEIVDVNDNAPEISVTSLMSPVREDAPIGTVVALITVKDKDSDKNGIVKCTLSGTTPFKLQFSYKNYYSLLVNGPLDRERDSVYNVTIMATDEGTPPLSNARVITVYVSDVNDNAPRFPHPVLNLYLKENSAVGALIKTVTAFDADVNENAQVTYSLVDSNIKDVPVSTMVNINPITGNIYSRQAFNYEQVKTFQFLILATDSGFPSMSSNATVNVFILDENDNRPEILPPYSTQGSVNTESIPYSAEAGYFVAKIRAVDADSGYNALLSYHIAEPKGTNLFKIGTSNGEIKTKRRMSDSDLRSHPLVILICDNGEPSLSASVTIEVMVVENNGELQTQFRKRPVQDDDFSSLNLYLLIAIVSVSVIFLLSLVSLVAVKCHSTDSSFNRYSAPMITAHPDGSWSYSKSTQQYDVCFSSDTLKSDVVVFPTSCPTAEADLISINEAYSLKRNQTLPKSEKVRVRLKLFISKLN